MGPARATWFLNGSIFLLRFGEKSLVNGPRLMTGKRNKRGVRGSTEKEASAAKRQIKHQLVTKEIVITWWTKKTAQLLTQKQRYMKFETCYPTFRSRFQIF